MANSFYVTVKKSKEYRVKTKNKSTWSHAFTHSKLCLIFFFLLYFQKKKSQFCCIEDIDRSYHIRIYEILIYYIIIIVIIHKTMIDIIIRILIDYGRL